ncbi:MAG: EAL domain-containing protein [Desulfarculaceae bacterium]|nr:EAL domain-containing protein [Desulfarculaceae bacterium]MCF8071308.1 EAL domain-containing protein [Desulfarculaceae bacterium]MCF8101633.1 EAL domain-containing protein [Desulfarculaceae bacterium]MCF8117427.1 EAL domain-containing protein [Desulfarculaceae bacterium]
MSPHRMETIHNWRDKLNASLERLELDQDRRHELRQVMESGLEVMERLRQELEQCRQHSRLLEQVLESTSEGIAVSDAKGDIEMCNAAFCSITGHEADTVRGQALKGLNNHHDADSVYQRIFKALDDTGIWGGEVVHKRPDGHEFHQWLSVARMGGGDGRLVWALRDISAIKNSEEKITYLAYHDALTGLPNRRLLSDRLEVAIATASRKNQRLALLFLDLDNFKHVNDGLGHAAGDDLLRETARRLEGRVRDEDTVARLGGDEFVMLLLGIQEPEYAAVVAQRVLDCLAKPFVLRDHELFLSASIGITLFPDDGRDAETLMANADMAMYRAKGAGRNNYKLFTPELNDKVQRRMALEGALRSAIDNQEFLVHYQPKVELDQGRVVGVEALVRWQRPELGLISPGEFIPLAEDTGQIVPIGQWVLEQACRQTKAWHDRGNDGLAVSVNLSPRQFQQKDLVPMVAETLGRTGLDPTCLELEVTESMVMDSVDEAIVTLEELHRLGVQLSMDDFGKGYSNLYYLKRFPMNTLKIDRSFVQDVAVDSDDASIVDTIINMSRGLRLKVIAEGVENREQLSFLRERRCDQIQGFLFSRPLPDDELFNLLASGLRLQ